MLQNHSSNKDRKTNTFWEIGKALRGESLFFLLHYSLSKPDYAKH
jgi:hypothetical protein